MPEPTANAFSFELIPDPDVMVRLINLYKNTHHFTLDRFVDSCIKAASVPGATFSSNLESSLSVQSFDFAVMRSEVSSGYPVRILYPGKQWMSGNVKVDVKTTVRFIPDEPPPDLSNQGSPLDDLR